MIIQIISLLLLILTSFSATAAGTRVASSAVCADQTVVALIEPERIAALSPQAHDPLLSAVAVQARNLPTLLPVAEAFVLVDAEVVVGMTWGKTRTLAMLERLGTQIVRLGTPEDFSAIASLLRSSATALGAPIRGERLAADLERRLALLKTRQLIRPLLRAVYIRPDGGSAGVGTFVDAVLEAAGFKSLATILGRDGWGRLDLETLIINPPEVIIAAFFKHPGVTLPNRSLSYRFSHHPVFRALWRRVPVIEIPSALMTCSAGPLIEAAELLAYYRRGFKGLQP